MNDFSNVPNLLALVNAAIDGKVSAADAGRGLPPVIETLFAISEKLGQLSRGKAIHFEPRQAGLLYEILDSATSIVLSGVTPTTAADQVAVRLMELAFKLDDPQTWAFRLSAIRDRPLGAGCGKPDDGPTTSERMAELSHKINADKALMSAYATCGVFDHARKLLDEVVDAISSDDAYPDEIEWSDTTLKQGDVFSLFEEIHDGLGYIETYLSECAKAHFSRVRDA